MTTELEALRAERDRLRARVAQLEEAQVPCRLRYVDKPDGYTCLTQISEAQDYPHRFTEDFRARILTHQELCDGCASRVALASSDSDSWLAAHDKELAHRHERIGRDDARNNMVVNILGRTMLSGAEADWTTVRSALAEHDAEVKAQARREALEEAAKLVEPKEPRPEPPDLSMYTNGDDAAFDLADHELTMRAAKLRALATTPSESKEKP